MIIVTACSHSEAPVFLRMMRTAILYDFRPGFDIYGYAHESGSFLEQDRQSSIRLR